MENEEKQDKLAKLFSNRGVYILLALGLAIVGVTGYVSKNRREYGPVIKDEQSIVQVPVFNEEPSIPIVKQVEKPVAKPKTEAVATAKIITPTETKIILPLQGELTTGFSVDTLVFSKTMQDWRVHTGIDIRGNVGNQIKAAADGVVSKLTKDEMMGISIEIKHENGIETIYSNLQSSDMVKVGQAVKQGDIIAGVGTTAQYEIGEPPHLHFEVKKDGIFVNPFDFMEK